MNTSDNQKRGGGIRLLAAFTVMAMALVVMAVCISSDSIESDADATTGYITVDGVAGAKESYASFEELYNDLKPKMKDALGGTDDIYGQETADAAKFKAFFTDNSMGTETDYDAKITYTIHGTVEYDEKDHSYLLSIGRAASYFKTDLHLSHFEIKGAENAELKVKSGFTLPYQWWKGDTHWTYLTMKDIKISNGGVENSIFSIGQANTMGISVELSNVHVSGLRCYSYINETYSYTAENCIFDGDNITNAGIHFQGSTDVSKKAEVIINGCTFNGYSYCLNIDQDSAIAEIKNNTFRNTDAYRPCIQIAGCSEATISNNTFYTIGNVLAFHEALAPTQDLVNKIEFNGNTVLDATDDGSAHFINTAKKNGTDAVSDATYSKVKVENNRIAETIDVKNGVDKNGKITPMNTNIRVSADQIVKKSSSGTVDIEKDDVKTTTGKSGSTSTITTTISSSTDLDASIDEALKQISLAGSAIGADSSARIVIETTGDAEISEESIAAMKESGVFLTVSGRAGSVSLDSDVLENLSGRGDVTVGISKASSLTPAQSSKIGTNTAIDVTATTNGTSVSSLGGTATISVQFESNWGAKVMYVAEDGSTQEMPCTYSNGVVTFTTTHFSVYMIAPAYTFIPIPDDGDDFPGYIPQPTPVQKDSKDESGTEVAILVACIAVVLIGIVTMVYKER